MPRREKKRVIHATRRNPRWLALVACCAAQALPAAGADDAGVAQPERWYEMRIGGVPAGYVHESVVVTPLGATTSAESVIVLNRLDTRVEIETREVDVEDGSGHLKEVHAQIRASKDATVLDVVVAGHDLSIATQSGGRTYRRVEHTEHELLGPEGIRALTARRLAGPAAAFDYATFVAELGTTAVVTRRVTGHEAASAGQPALYDVEESSAEVPLPSQLRIAADGHVIEERQPGPFGDVTLVAATAAVREAARGGQLSEDLYRRSLVRANVRLPQPRSIERLRVRIDLKRPELGFPELEGPDQHVIERAPDHVVLEIRRAAALDGPPSAAEKTYTEANAILQSDHPDVAALAATLRRPGAGPYAQARVLRDWVAEHMSFDPGLAIVPASEAVRDRRGSCVAYAVLLASLARALAIPARIVMGYVYLDNVWGGHAWAEVQAGGRWIPLDAAVYDAGPADAARIALVHHTADQGLASGAADLVRVFGNESIRIEGFGLDGAWVDVPADATPYTIDGRQYRNPWLRLTIDRPAEFAFADADAAYPDATVIALTGPAASEIRLRQEGARSARSGSAELLRAAGYARSEAGATVAGRSALRAVGDGTAAVVFRDGTDLWLLEANGTAGVGALDAVAASLRLGRGTASSSAPQ